MLVKNVGTELYTSRNARYAKKIVIRILRFSRLN